MTQSRHRLSRVEFAIAAVLVVLSATVYIRTLAPGLLYGDSAEFQTLSASPGMTHATGYPIYILLGWVFTRLPFGDAAYNINLMSAVFAGLTIGMVYLIGVVLSERRWLPVTGAVALAISYTFWSQAIIAELYTVGMAFSGAILLLVLHWYTNGSVRALLLAGILGGVSLGVHLSIVLMAPAILIFMMLVKATRRDWRWALSGAGLGLIVWLGTYAAVDAMNSPASYYNTVVYPSLSTWNLTESDFDSLPERMIFLLSAQQFRPLMFSIPLGEVAGRAETYLEGLGREFSGVGLAFAAIGLIVSWRNNWRTGLLILLSFAVHLFYDLNYDVYDIEVFYLPTYLIIVLWCSLGAVWLAGGIYRLLTRRLPAFIEAGFFITLLIIVLLPFVESRVNALQKGLADFIETDYPMPIYNLNEPHDRAEALVSALPDEVVLFTDWDLLYALYYVAHVEQNRQGMAFHESYPQDGVDVLANSTITYIETVLQSGRSVYVMERFPELNEYFRFRPFRTSAGRLFEVTLRVGNEGNND